MSVEHRDKFKEIFTFWEPKESMTPYLKLCLKTWERRLPQYKIIILNYSNLDNYISPETYDIALLKKFKLMTQKDAVMVAVLEEHGGIFMDADTLALRDLNPIVSRLDETEAVMFGTHCAFIAARPGSYLLKLWRKAIQDKMLCVSNGGQNVKDLSWDFFSNSALESAMNEIIMSNKFVSAIQKYTVDNWACYLKEKTKKDKVATFRGRELLHRISNSVLARKRHLLFSTVYKRYLTMLDRVEYGFISEAKYFKSKFMDPQEKYRQFWFDNKCDIKNVFMDKQSLIGLHHSWTPQWYKDFSEKDVLEHSCLLSKTLKYLIEDDDPWSLYRKEGTPLVSVIMPVYNGAAYLPYALKSVDAQSYDNLEIIVIDDGSTDETAEIARSHPKVRYQYQSHHGISNARNGGLHLARGEYITFLDDDDWWSENKLILQLGLMKESSAQIVAGYVQPVKFADTSGNRDFKQFGEPYSLLNLGSALFHASVFKKIGPFDTDFQLCGDWDWFMRAREAAVEILIHPDIVLYYLRHTKNVTNESTVIQKSLLKLFKKTLERRRKAGLTSPLPSFGDFLKKSGLPIHDIKL